jgi:hypothetical protein
VSVSALIDRAPPGILIFSASKGREESEESADHGGGVFTSAVIAALSDPKTDRNHNGVIEASELYASVKRAVVETTQPSVLYLAHGICRNHRSLRKAEAGPRSCFNAPGPVVRLSHVCLPHFLNAGDRAPGGHRRRDRDRGQFEELNAGDERLNKCKGIENSSARA